MNETERNQIKGALLKCAEENQNKIVCTGCVVISSVCKAAVERIVELEKENGWIDLASNPDNLPEYEEPVEIWLEGCEYPRVAHRESLGGGTWRWWVYWGSGYEIGNKSIVVAWRKIVPPKRSKNEN